MSVVSCQIDVPKHETSLGQASAEITVGRQFLLQCEGEWPELSAQKMELRLEPADKYKLQILKFEKTTSSHAQILATSYKAGEHKLKAVQLVDPEHSVVLGDLSFTVKSVINPQEPESEPFGPMGPITFGLPWYYFAIPAFVLLLIAAWVFTRLRRRSQKKKLVAEMNLSRSALQPMAEVSQKLRQFSRVSHTAEVKDLIPQVNEAFRIYLARRFLIPTLAWNDKLILKDFKKNHSDVFEVAGKSVQQTLIELARAKSASAKLELKDLEQLMSLVRKSSELIEKEFANKSQQQKEKN